MTAPLMPCQRHGLPLAWSWVHEQQAAGNHALAERVAQSVRPARTSRSNVVGHRKPGVWCIGGRCTSGGLQSRQGIVMAPSGLLLGPKPNACSIHLTAAHTIRTPHERPHQP